MNFHYVNRTLNSYNDDEDVIYFKDLNELTRFMKIRDIEEEQEFYFVLTEKSLNFVYCSYSEYINS